MHIGDGHKDEVEKEDLMQGEIEFLGIANEDPKAKLWEVEGLESVDHDGEKCECVWLMISWRLRMSEEELGQGFRVLLHQRSEFLEFP